MHRLTGIWFALIFSLSAQAADLPMLADIHLHWKWNQKEVTQAAEAVQILREQNVGLAVVTGTPPELALELQELAPDIVLPIYGVYRIPGEWSSWHHDRDLARRVREALGSGRYFGIGEIHMIGGFISDWRNPVIAELFAIAAEFDVPVLVHTEFSRANYTLGMCQAYPRTRFLWAHAGSMLKPAEVRRVLEGCANLQVELSARDPWRHRGNPVSDDTGRLRPEWRALVSDHADRFMIGSDPVWPVDRLNPWDEPDTGWQELSRFLDFHRNWLDALPEAEARAIRWENAQRFFRPDATR